MILNELKKELEELDKLAEETARRETGTSTEHSLREQIKQRDQDTDENEDYSIEIDECLQPHKTLPKSSIIRKSKTHTGFQFNSLMNQSLLFQERKHEANLRQNQSFDLGGWKEGVTFIMEQPEQKQRDSFIYKSQFSPVLCSSQIIGDETAVILPYSFIQAINRIESDDFLVNGNALLFDFDLGEAETPQQRGQILKQRIQNLSQSYTLPQKIIIELPGSHIIIEEEPLKITIPLTIKGKPGTLLEIQSSIIIDIESGPSSNQPSPLHSFLTQKYSIPFVWFNECSILFNYLPAVDEGFRQKNLKCLFSIHKGSNLIVRDCLLRSKLNQQLVKSTDYFIGQTYDVCFALKTPDISSRSTALSSELALDDDKRDSQLQILSSTLEGFTHFIYGGEDSFIKVEFSSLSNSRCNAIELLNPRKFVFERSLVQKTLGSAISINFQRQEGVTDNKIERQVVIDSSKIIGNIGYGVKIKCEKELSKVKQRSSIGTSLSRVRGHLNSYLVYPKIKLIQIRKTRIYQCKKDGIMIQNILMHPNNGIVQIDKCDIGHNKQNNIFMQGITRPYLLVPPEEGSDQARAAKIHAIVKRSRLSEAMSGFGVYSYNGNFEVEDCEIVGNQSGGIMVVGRKDEESTYVRVNQSTISSNNDSGIVLIDLKGTAQIKRCSIDENKKNGIKIQQNLDPSLYKFETGDSNYQASITPEENLEIIKQSGALLYVQTCDISRNRSHGIQFKNVLVKLKDVMMDQNFKNAVYMVYASSLCLNLIERKSISVRRQILGQIGGAWGRWIPQRQQEWGAPKEKKKEVRRGCCFGKI